MSYLVKLDDVSFRYPGACKWSLSSANLEIPQGSFFALLGPNGAGKTTLLRLLCGRFPCFHGKLDIAEPFKGKNGFLDPSVYGVLLENPGIYPKLSIEEYLAYFAGFYGFGESGTREQRNIRERMERFSRKLDLPSLSTKMSSLSLGNRQKVQVLRAMLPNPRLLILDEPVANLDPISREIVWSLISDWRKNDGGTAIVCSHILAEMDAEATDFAIIDKGQVLRSGTVGLSQSQQNCGKSVKVDFAESVSLDQVKSALEAAGISVDAVSLPSSGLSELYQQTVRNI